MTSTSTKSYADAMNIRAEMPISEKVQCLQRFLGDHYFHESGIMYAMWYWRGNELRPYTAADIHPDQEYLCTSADFSPEGLINAENSMSTSGWFLTSQCLRYEATGEEEALQLAQKAFKSIETVYQFTEIDGREGFICKPYDWKASVETSMDQYVAVMIGLWHYYTITERETRQRIAEMLCRMADWWPKQNYETIYFEQKSDLLPYHAERFACLNAMAYHVSHEHRYMDECCKMLAIAGSWPTVFDKQLERILRLNPNEELRSGSEHPFESYDSTASRFLFRFREYQGEIYLGAFCANWFIENETTLAPSLKSALVRRWHQMQFGLRKDFLSLYAMEVDLQNETWQAVHTRPTDEQRSSAMANSLIGIYFSEVCWGDMASRIPDISIMVACGAKEFSATSLPLARSMLRALDNRRLHWMIDPDGEQLLDEIKWQQWVLSSDAPAFTLMAYWRAMSRLLPHERQYLLADEESKE